MANGVAAGAKSRLLLSASVFAVLLSTPPAFAQTITETGFVSPSVAGSGTTVGNLSIANGAQDGSVSISGGAVLNTTAVFLALDPGRTASLSLTGVGSQLTASDSLQVGHSGSASVSIGAGSSVLQQGASGGGTFVGFFSGSNSSISVSGPGALLTTANTLQIGGNGSGSLTVENGGVANHTGGASSVTIGNAVGSVGTATVTGVGSQLTTNNGLNVAFQGSGTLNIQAGGSVTAQSGNSFIGNQAGSTGVVTLSGAGSSLTTAGTLSIGNFGTGTLNVGAGTNVTAQGLFGPTFVGQVANSSGTINIDGGSMTVLQTEAGPTPGPQSHSSLGVGRAGTGAVNVTNGGTLTIGNAASGTQPGSTFGAGINIGGDSGGGGVSGTGTMTVSGAGSKIETLGVGSFINVGRFNNVDPGNLSSLAISSGGVVNTMGATVGQAGANGQLTLDGAGSQVNLIGVRHGGNGASMTIGQGASTGTVTVGNGGALTINATGATAGPGGIAVGNDATSVGTLNLQSGGSLSITSDRVGTGMTVGRLGQGNLNISGGSTFTINDNSAPGTGGISFGGNGGVATGGAFSGLITGAGTTVAINGTDTFFQVGRNNGSSGTVTISNGATVGADIAIVGLLAGSSGTLNVSGAGAALNLTGDAAGTFGTSLVVARSGNGTATISNGASVSINSAAVPVGAEPGGSIQIGGSNTVGGGTGTLNVTSGATVSLTGTDIGLTLGRDPAGTAPSNGTLNINSGGQVTLGANGRGSIGYSSNSTGAATVDGGNSTLNAGSYLGIGYDLAGNAGGTGSLTVTNGGQVQATTIENRGTLSLGTTPNTALIGNVTNRGAMSFASGANIGDGITDHVRGALTVTGGGMVTQTDNNATINIGNVAGTTGSVTVDGAGSSFTVNNGLNVGNQGTGTLTVGPGGSVTQLGLGGGGTFVGNVAGSNGTLNINGGSMTVQRSELGAPVPPATTAERHGFISIGNGGTGALNVTNGGTLTIGDANSGTQANSTFGAGLNIGGNAPANFGTGAVTVSGAGSVINLMGTSAFIGVGRNGLGNAGTEGALTVLNGGSVSGARTMTIGRDGADGSVLVDGTGSSLSLGGVALNGNAAGATLGFGAASGTLTVQNNGAVSIVSNGATTSSPGLTLGQDAASSGTVNVAGGTLTITGDRGGSGITVGRLGSGALNVTGGGALTINDTSATGGGGISFGGNGLSGTGGAFNGLVSGVGSTLSVLGTDKGLLLGGASGGSGTLTVQTGAAVNTNFVSVGHAAGTNATFNLSGATLNLSDDNGAGTVGAGFTVGRSGTGTATISNGAVLAINGTATNSPTGITVGGSSTGSGGNGTLTVTGAGTQINVTASAAANGGLQIGRDNTGTTPTTGSMTISDGAVVTLAAGSNSSIGTTAGSSGALTITGAGSLLNAGSFLGIGRTQSNANGGTGLLNVTLGGTVQASTIHNGATGTISGSGTLIADTFINDGTLNPGNSPGTLRLSVADFQNNGTIVLEIQDLGGGNFITDVLVFDDGFVPDLNQIEFAFLGGTDPNAAATQGILDIDNFLKIETAPGVIESITDALAGDPTLLQQFQEELAETSFTGSAGGGTQIVTFTGYDPNAGTVRDIVITPVPTDVPEPATMLLFVSGLAGLEWLRRRRRAA
jgi:T5SS/PEP-CTERM-associated repeat protein